MRVLFAYLNHDRVTARGPGYLVAAMRNAGHEVRFADTAYCSLDEAAAMAVGCGVIMLSATTLLFGDAKELAKKIRQLEAADRALADIPIVLGGVHPTVMGATLLTEAPEIDYLCIGEGERFVVDFLARLDRPDFGDLPGLAYLLDGTPHLNLPGPPTDLDTLPSFPYGLFRPSSVVLNGPLPGFVYVGATRGCPYSCTYCCNSIYLQLYHGQYLRMRDVDLVIQELIQLKADYPAARVLFFGDEMILFNRDYCRELFTRISREVGLHYGCMARVERIDEETVDIMRETGCKYVGLGVECGDEEFRRTFLNRRMSNEQIVRAFQLLRTIPGVMLASYNMHRFPVPNDAELTHKTDELNRTIAPDIVQMTTFFPFPGTRLHQYCVENDLIDLGKLETVTDVFTQSVLKGMSKECSQ